MTKIKRKAGRPSEKKKGVNIKFRDDGTMVKQIEYLRGKLKEAFPETPQNELSASNIIRACVKLAYDGILREEKIRNS